MLDEVKTDATDPNTRFARLRRSFDALSRRAMSTSRRLSAGEGSSTIATLVDEEDPLLAKWNNFRAAVLIPYSVPKLASMSALAKVGRTSSMSSESSVSS